MEEGRVEGKKMEGGERKKEDRGMENEPMEGRLISLTLRLLDNLEDKVGVGSNPPWVVTFQCVIFSFLPRRPLHHTILLSSSGLY